MISVFSLLPLPWTSNPNKCAT